ncbi:MAG: hypothetical protein IPL41_01645 [Micropruina sp.]|nr:hypothetical protein [Micropruina sp.]
MNPRNTETGDGFSAEERAAMKERAAELRASKRGGNKAAAEAQDCLDKIAALPDGDRAIAEAIHAIVTENAPELAPKTWYGMPAYARDGKVVCFFQPASKFDARYGTFGFNDVATLDDGEIWPVTFAVTTMTDQAKQQFADLVRRAVS